MNYLLLGYQIKNRLHVIPALVIWWLILQLEHVGAHLVILCLMIRLTIVSFYNVLGQFFLSADSFSFALQGGL